MTLPARGGDLQSIHHAEWVDAEFNDGDSFMTRFADPATGEPREEVVRLYYVDAPEVSLGDASDRRRALEQSRYFGLDDPLAIVTAGEASARFVRRLLAGKPFTLHTAFANALGRSQKPRIYAMVTTASGDDLAALLVRHGHARAYGIARQMPDGTPSSEHARYLDDVEIAASMNKAGVWGATNPEAIAELRAQQREDDRRVDAALKFGVFSNLDAATPLEINSATVEELQQLEGIGPELANRIREARPFRAVDDLVRVRGIGEVTLEKIRGFVRAEPPAPE